MKAAKEKAKNELFSIIFHDENAIAVTLSGATINVLNMEKSILVTQICPFKSTIL